MLKYSLLQHPENFLEKSLTLPKKLKGGPFWIFQHPFCRKLIKKLKVGPSGIFSKKSLAMPKKN